MNHLILGLISVISTWFLVIVAILLALYVEQHYYSNWPKTRATIDHMIYVIFNIIIIIIVVVVVVVVVMIVVEIVVVSSSSSSSSFRSWRELKMMRSVL